jgi:hypothetical protein
MTELDFITLIEDLMRKAFIDGYAAGTEDDDGIYDDEGRVRTDASTWEDRAEEAWEEDKSVLMKDIPTHHYFEK